MLRGLLALLLLVAMLLACVGAARAVNRTGGPGPDRLVGTVRADDLRGRGGNDLLIGRAGNDLLAGDAGRDTVRAGPGDDTVLGGGGGDRISGGGGADIIVGGRGGDRINARDGVPDRVLCGPRFDVVRADGADRVARDCERVRR